MSKLLCSDRSLRVFLGGYRCCNTSLNGLWWNKLHAWSLSKWSSACAITTDKHGGLPRTSYSTTPNQETASVLLWCPSWIPSSCSHQTKASNGVPHGHKSTDNHCEHLWPLPEVPFSSVVWPGLSNLSNLHTHKTSPSSLPESTETNWEPPWLFSNMSTWRLMKWMNTGSQSKSEGEVTCLINEVLDAPDFCAEDLHDFNAHWENSRLDAANKLNLLDDGFQVTSITIDVPTGEPGDSEKSHSYLVPGLHYRKLLNVVKAAFQDPLLQYFHLIPFSLMHRSPVTGEEQCVYGELYNSDTFIKEHHHVQNCSRPPPDDPGCKLEKVIAALMFWSNLTHLTNFGTATLWPIYLFFSNLSKYIWSQPSSGACNHLAYIPSVCTCQNVGPHICWIALQLPDLFESWIASWHPHWETQRNQLMAHCWRELMQAIWKYMLDDDFIHAMIYGVVVTYYNGIKRQIYPWIFTYSANYPEK